MDYTGLASLLMGDEPITDGLRQQMTVNALRPKKQSTSLPGRVTPPSVAPQSAGIAGTAEVPQGSMPQGRSTDGEYDRLMGERERYSKLVESAGAAPDYGPVQEYAKTRAGEGNRALVMALAAQQAGKDFAPMQAHFLKRAMEAREPIKMTGGLVTSEGGFIADPEAQQAQRLRMYETRISQIDRALSGNLDRQSREQLQRERLEMQQQLATQAQQARQDLAGMVAANRPEPMLPVQQPDGSVVYMPRSQAAGMPVGKPGGVRMSDKTKSDLAAADSTETGIANAVNALERSSGGGTGWVAGMVQNKLPGGQSVVADWRDQGTNSAIQQLTYWTDAIRHDRFGSALTATEKASAAQYLPSEYDDKAKLLAKARGLQQLIQLNNSRLRQQHGVAPPEAPSQSDASVPQVPGAAPAPAAPSVQQRASSYMGAK